MSRGLANLRILYYNNTVRVDKNNKKLKLEGLKNKERIAN